MFRHALAALAAITVLPATASADRWENQVRVQMVGAVVGAAANGFTLSEQIQMGSLRQGQQTTYRVDFARNRDYALVALCDADCRDIDLVLVEPDGRESAADRDFTDRAVIRVPASHKGEHYLRVTMPSCSVNPCRFGIGVFTR
jgi:hypothetical protein